MRLLKCLAVTLFCFISFISFSFADVQIKTAKDFASVKAIIESAIQQDGGTHVLVAFDDDDTLLTMPEALGSIGWIEWQQDLFKQYQETGKRDPALIADTEAGIYQAQGILFDLSQMNPTAHNIPAAIKEFARQGASIMVATAREPDYQDATVSQLIRAGFTDNSGKLIFNDTAPRALNGLPSSDGLFNPSVGTTKLPLLYTSGIYFLSGQNKGNMLISFLEKFHVQGKTTLIFVDDQMNNVQDVYNAMLHYPALKNVISIHYTREDGRQAAFLKNDKKQQDQAKKAWDHLTAAIKQALPKNQLPK